VAFHRLLKAHALRIVVYEHVSGGGYARHAIPPSVLSEGFAMLRCVVSDFKAAGHEVTVLLDDRLSRLNPPIDADCIVPVSYDSEPKRFFSNIAKINDAIYIIAPETGQTLQSLVQVAEHTGKVSLNCESSAIAKTADKTILHQTLQKLIVTPKTDILNVEDNSTKAKRTIKKELGYPVVVKPADGVSCSGLSLIKEEAQIEKAIAKIRAESSTKCFIAQEYIDGETASVSLLSTGKEAFAISLNKQHVTLADPDGTSSYEGGAVPLDHPLKQEALSLAEKVVESISGLRGYVGVDLVLAEDMAYVCDVNARLTASYVGLHEVAGFNVAEALVNAVLKGKLPKKTGNRWYACFSKMESQKPTLTTFQKAAALSAVVSPPFPLNGNAKVCSMLVGNGASLKEATVHLEEAKKRLLNIIM
jgi:predicted ATP-grasp superfamily ATP-dependent carboligase